MAYTEANRVQIRKYLGAGSVYLQLFPKLENAITATQSIADGGVRPDNSTETEVLSYVTKLQTIEVRLEELQIQMAVTQAGKDEVTLNNAQGVSLLRKEGRRMVGVISRMLACAPVFDFFSGQAPSSEDFSNIYSRL
jgi:hypothetical protein